MVRLRTKKTYFEPKEWEQQEALDPEQYYNELRNAFVSKSAALFQRARTGWNVGDRWSGHAHHPGVAQGGSQTRCLATRGAARIATMRM